ncbi:conserved protein of unknown function [Methylacidimicrobium sp. AP8]|uniref:type III-B CRISPR module RAMP protein Cmr4 n=1 Tax=Methylacidimicrobium sp. AP8 TaxID=2730359 RepID=UPI0018C0A21C|nr:type III-B CRISPR module RAMP protein Cmr4 [Methylacidimicrobium sp. AP8]CAB4243089.1 conserved protein of unknown function [Methylacidimicrobium sp. AP8]
MSQASQTEQNGVSGTAGESSLCFPLYIFTRTPLHVGAGASVGAIDLPIQRERHTGFPVIPGSTLKGVFADGWNQESAEENGPKLSRSKEGCWLFGSEDPDSGSAGALQFSEAKLLAFPIRSAKCCFAWISSPLILQRYARDVASLGEIPRMPGDAEALYKKDLLDWGEKAILEEYTFRWAGDPPSGLGENLAALLPGDPIWETVSRRIVILSDASLSFFVRSACEVAQHVRISDETGAAEEQGLFNQENVPSETMFYALVRASRGRGRDGARQKTAKEAAEAFGGMVEKEKGVFQFGADAGTGLGFCTVKIKMDWKQ